MPERSNGNQTVRFGPYEADQAAAELRKNGIRLKLQEQPFQVLWALLERPGEVVTRDELRQRLWAEDTFVDFDNALNRAVNKIREALDGSARHPRFVETVPRRGYRWVGPTPTPLGREKPSPAPRPIQAFAYIASAALVLALAGGGVWVWAVNGPSHSPPERPLKAVPLTSYEGSEVSPSFSPDGNQVAFAWNGESRANFDVYVQTIGSGSPLPRTSDPADDLAPAWSPDGRYIAFLRAVPESVNGQATLYVIPPLGGTERKVVEGRFLRGLFFPVDIAWSPDAERLFLREWDGAADRICEVELNSGKKRYLTSPPLHARDYAPALSPDGETLAFGRQRPADESALYLTPVQGGESRHLAMVDGFVKGVAWLPNSRELIYSLQMKELAPSMWRIATDGSAPRRIDIPGGEGLGPALSPSGERLVYERGVTDCNIWRYDLPHGIGDSRRPRKIIFSTQLDGAAQISPQGDRIVFGSTRSGSYEIWVAASDGSNQLKLTSMEPSVGSPRWSPDGRTIAFDTFGETDGDNAIYLIDADGGPARRLAIEGRGVAQRPSWSYDGKWIYFTSRRSGSQQIWKVPSTGGKPIQITREGGNHPFESPDGKIVYYVGENSVWRVPVDGGEESLVLAGLKSGNGDRWDVTAEGIYFVDEEVDDPAFESRWVLKLLRFENEEISVVSQLDGPPCGPTGLDVSPDGKWFIYVQADRRDSDLMLVENFR